MALMTKLVCSLMVSAVLTSSLVAEHLHPRTSESQWSKRTSNAGNDWVPLSAPCPSCQPNDRISSESDHVASLLTPPLPDYQQIVNFQTQKQFQGQQGPIAQQLIRQTNGHQQFVPPVKPKFAPSLEPLQPILPIIAKIPTEHKTFVPTATSQFVQQPHRDLQLPALQENSNLATGGQNQFNQPHIQQEFPLQEHSLTQLIGQDSQVQYNIDPNQNQNQHSQYQNFLGQFLQPQQSHLNLNLQTSNESQLSPLNEEKPEVQLVYVPVEALNQKGRFNLPYKKASNEFTEVKSDFLVQQEPLALAAEESRQQRQQFQPYFEQQYPIDQLQAQRPNAVRQLVLSTEQAQQHQGVEINQQDTHEELQVNKPQHTDTPQRIQDQNQSQLRGQQVLQSLRAHPTGIPQQLQPHPQLQVSDVQAAVPIQDPYSTRLPQLQRQYQQQSQHESLINQDHFLKYLRPLPTVAAQLLQQQQQQRQHIQETQPPPAPRLLVTQIPQLQQHQPSHEDRFIQTQQPFFASTSQGQQQQEYVTANPQLADPHFLEAQKASAPQQRHQTVTRPVTQQPLLDSQQRLQSTKKPQIQKSDQRHSQHSTTAKPSKPVPHQPPLSVYMGREGHEINIADVIKVLKNAKTIAVLDSVGPESPQIFVGPSNLKPPSSYAKFELPYLSSIESNRVERKVDRLPFFVAPLNFNPPAGYSKIPFPAPHIGSVVVSNVSETDSTPAKVDVNPSTIKPHRGRFSSQYSLPADLPAINPQLPTLVNSLQDSRQPGNVFLTATKEQANSNPHPTGRPYQQTPVQHFQQVPHQQKQQPFQEIHQVSEAPLTSHITQSPDTPQINQYSNVQYVTTTPQPQRFPIDTQQVQHEQLSQVETTPEFIQTIPTVPASQPSQFPQNYLREEQEISQFGQFPSHTRLISPSIQNLPLQPTEITQAPVIPQLQTFSALKRVPQPNKSQQIQEDNNFSPAPEIQLHQSEKVVPELQVDIRSQQVKKEEQQPELPSTPLPRIPKRRPSYRARQRTTEASITDEISTTTRKPYTRGRRPYTIRQRGQPQDTQNQQDSSSTITTRNQFQADVEPSSTTEFFTGFKYTTRAPTTRSKIDGMFQDSKTQAQEEPPKRNSVLRTRSRTRERNSQRVSGQSVPSYQTQLSEKKPSNLNIQDEQDTVVPPHESKRQQFAFNQYYNTERSGFEVPTTENSKFEQINSNLPQQISHTDEIAYQEQLGLKFQSVRPVSPTISTGTAYQTNDSGFPALSTSQSYENPFQGINNPISTTTAQPELNSFVPRQHPQSAERHHARVHPQLVNEQPARFPQFTLPVQVSVSGQTEVPEIEDTPRPVYVRIRGHTRGRRPQNHDTAGIQRAVPKYQQQQEASESPKTHIPQEQRLVYQNQNTVRGSNTVQHRQLQVPRQSVSSETVEDERARTVDSSRSNESEEVYGFIRPISFPASIPTVDYQETSVRSRQSNYFQDSQPQGSQGSVEDLDQNIPINEEHQNVPVAANKPKGIAIEESTTPATTVFTIRPSRRHPAVKQQMRITSIRGRMRRPTTSTTEQTQSVIEDFQPTSTAPQLIRRRPVNRFTPSLTSNEVSEQSHEAFATPRSSLQRYETPIRGKADAQKPIVSNEDQIFMEPSSTASTFQITLLDDPPNYPPAYSKAYRGQNEGNSQQDGYEHVAPFNRYFNEDPEGGAESQWATKRLPFIYTGQDESTIALITFTTELPSSEQIVTEVPLLPSKENTTVNDLANLGNVGTSNKTLPFHQEVEPPTTVYPTDFSSHVFHVESDKTLDKDQKELFSSQKKASDHNLDKKSSTGRRGTWVRVRKVHKPHDFLETAESQNIGALSRNQLQTMVSKGSLIHSWPAPAPTVGLDEIEPHPEHYITLDESADDDVINSTSLHNNSFDREQTFGNAATFFGENLSTTTEENSVTEVYRNEETTTLYISPRPTEDATITTRVFKEIASLTTESPIIETSTNVHLTETIQSTDFNQSRSNSTSDEYLNNHMKNETHVSPDDQMENRSKNETAAIDEVYKDERNNNAKTSEVTHAQTNIDNDTIVETTTEPQLILQTKEETTERSFDSVKDNISGEIVDAVSSESDGKANEAHLLIQSSVRDAIQQNTPTLGTTDTPNILQAIENMFSESATTTEVSLSGINLPEEIVRTSMRTEISHETEICFRGRCVKTKSTDNDHLIE